MKFLIKTLSLLNIFILLIKADYGSSSKNSNKHQHYEHAKYSANLNTNNKHSEIPTLESLFHRVSYRDSNNHSSPCTHTGHDIHKRCHKVVTFDHVAYEKSLQETRRMILNRLNLEHEPNIKINKNTVNFIEQLENKIFSEGGQKSANSRLKYEKKQIHNKEFNTMHEASIVSESCPSNSDHAPSLDTLCISFEIPLKNFLTKPQTQRKLISVELWLYVTPLVNLNQIDGLKIYKLKKHSNNLVNVEKLLKKWNTIDLTSLVKIPVVNEENKNSNLSCSFKIKCLNGCSMGIAEQDEITDFEDQYDESRSVLISNRPGRKPVLSIKMEEFDEVSEKAKRMKRKASGHHTSQSSSYNNNNNHNNYIGSNFRAQGLDREPYQPKYCDGNSKDQECCLSSFYVNFNALGWTSWVLSPSGFVANFCNGKCNDLRSFKYASDNAGFKIRINEQFLSRDIFDSSEMLETCCHPIRMDSLRITYTAMNNSFINKELTNMIVTGCGCS